MTVNDSGLPPLLIGCVVIKGTPTTVAIDVQPQPSSTGRVGSFFGCGVFFSALAACFLLGAALFLAGFFLPPYINARPTVRETKIKGVTRNRPALVLHLITLRGNHPNAAQLYAPDSVMCITVRSACCL